MAAALALTRRELAVGGAVSAQDVISALQSILGGSAFAHSPSLAAFLRFVVAATLAGRGGELKGYTIAVEGLGRPADFDPQTDSIVRVDAGRIRNALARHYATEGARDAVVIESPRGKYTPTFSHGARPSTIAPAVVEARRSMNTDLLHARATAQTCRLLLNRMASNQAALGAEIASVRDTITCVRKLVTSSGPLDDPSRVERS